MESEDQALRADLEAARDAVRQGIDRLLGAGSLSGAAGDENVLQDLQNELDQIEEALSNLGGT